MEDAGKDPIFNFEYILDDLESQWLKPFIFTAKDEDVVGFKFLGESDPYYRLIDTVNLIHDFEPLQKKVDLYEEDLVCGYINIEFQAISEELQKAMEDKKIKEKEQQRLSSNKMIGETNMVLLIKEISFNAHITES